MLFHRFLQESPKRAAKTASIGRQGRDAGPYPVPSGKQMESSVKVSLPNFVAGAIGAVNCKTARSLSLCRIALSRSAASRCASKIEMDSILAMRQRGTVRRGNATYCKPGLTCTAVALWPHSYCRGPLCTGCSSPPASPNKTELSQSLSSQGPAPATEQESRPNGH